MMIVIESIGVNELVTDLGERGKGEKRPEADYIWTPRLIPAASTRFCRGQAGTVSLWDCCGPVHGHEGEIGLFCGRPYRSPLARRVCGASSSFEHYLLLAWKTDAAVIGSAPLAAHS